MLSMLSIKSTLRGCPDRRHSTFSHALIMLLVLQRSCGSTGAQAAWQAPLVEKHATTASPPGSIAYLCKASQVFAMRSSICTRTHGRLSMKSMPRLHGPTNSMAHWSRTPQVPAIGELCLALSCSPDAGQAALNGEDAATAWAHGQHGAFVQGLSRAPRYGRSLLGLMEARHICLWPDKTCNGGALPGPTEACNNC